MLPATTRKKLRIPHHLAILAAGVSMALAFYVDLHQRGDEASALLSESQAEESHAPETITHAEEPSGKAVSPSRIRFDLPRLLPWAEPKPRSE